MPHLTACPFCRQLFPPNEAKSCPDCGLRLEDMRALPPSYDAEVEFPTDPTPPHMEPLPWGFYRRNRGALVAIALLGLIAFLTPWVNETAPERQVLSGLDLARISSFFWAPAVAWFVTIPLVITRRSIYRMRGSRVAVAFLAGIALVTVALLFAKPPASSHFRVVRIEWCWGLYLSGAAGLAGVIAAFGFGGRLDDIPTRQRRRGDEVLH